MSTFTLKVFTPEGAVLEEEVSSVTLKGADGEIGILPGHARYAGLLGTGKLIATLAGGQQRTIVASEGFCKFANNELTVLADTVDVEAIKDTSKLQEQIEIAKQELAQANLYQPSANSKRVRLERLEALKQL